jgi:hypothetical protein
MNINIERYYESISIQGFIKRYKNIPRNKIGKIVISLNEKIICWLIFGFKYIKDERIKGHKTWNDNYHLLSKLCRYESWDNVKINLWDKIRFKIVTGYKFE